MSILLKKAFLSLTIASTLVSGSSGLLSNASAVTKEATTVSQNATEQATEVIESEKADYKLKITAQLEKEGWYSDKANVKVKVEKIYGNSKFKIEKVEAKIGSTGAWIDITDDMSFEIQENCTTYIKVTDVYGAEFEKARSFKCFDTVAPTLNAAVNEGLLNIMTYDTESGVKEVYVNEYSFVPDQNGVITVRLQKFDASYQKFYIYAVDNAGNMSPVNTIANPYYKDPNASEEDEDSDAANPADSLPSNADANVTNPSTGTVTSVTDEDGNDISTEVKRKQFYTIVTADGQQYYLVIDMSAAYTDDDGVNVTPDDGTVYFLTSVSNQNLLNFVDGNEQTLPQNSIAANNSIDDETVTPEMDESTEATTEEEPEPVEKKKSSGSNLILYVIVGLVAFVVIGVKVLGGKKGKADQNDDELYGEGEEEEDEPEPLESLDETEE